MVRTGLPLAIQIVGRRFDEPGILRVARTVERLIQWDGPRPSEV